MIRSFASDGTRDTVVIEWNDPAFEMPLPVQIGEHRELVAMPGGRVQLTADPGSEVVVDPDREVLIAER